MKEVLKSFIDYEKEEQWLADMALKGLLFTDVGANGHRFIECAPHSEVFRIDYRTFIRKVDIDEYVELFSQSGWEHVYGTKRSGTQYFKRIRSDASEDIFSDDASRGSRYRRAGRVWLLFTCIFGMLTIGQLAAYGLDFSSFTEALNSFAEQAPSTNEPETITGWLFGSLLRIAGNVLRIVLAFLAPLIFIGSAVTFLILYLKSHTLSQRRASES
jgi:hypothetical protein